jgi:hypothetical protein
MSEVSASAASPVRSKCATSSGSATPGMDQGQLVVATANQKIGPPARPQCEGFVAQRHRLGQRLAVHRDHDRLGTSQLRIHDAGIGAVDQTQPQPLARSHLEAGAWTGRSP